MKLDDILKLVQQLLAMYQKGSDRERIEVILENIYALMMESENADDDVIDFMDAIMFDIDSLIDNRSEIVAKGTDEKANRKRRQSMLDMFREEY